MNGSETGTSRTAPPSGGHGPRGKTSEFPSPGIESSSVPELAAGAEEFASGPAVVQRSAGAFAPVDRVRRSGSEWSSNSLLGRLREGSRQELLTMGTVVRFPAGRKVIEQDANDTHALLLLDGMVKVQASAETGDTALLAIRVAGDLVGEMSALDQKPRSATALTCGDVVAKMISGTDLTAYLQRRTDAFVELLATMNDQLRWANQRRREFLSHPAVQRVARVICDLVQAHGREESEGWVLGIPLTKVELASIAGMKPRTAEKAFSDLSKSGLVVTHLRRVVVIPDLHRLREFAG